MSSVFISQKLFPRGYGPAAIVICSAMNKKRKSNRVKVCTRDTRYRQAMLILRCTQKDLLLLGCVHHDPWQLGCLSSMVVKSHGFWQWNCHNSSSSPGAVPQLLPLPCYHGHYPRKLHQQHRFAILEVIGHFYCGVFSSGMYRLSLC